MVRLILMMFALVWLTACDNKTPPVVPEPTETPQSSPATEASPTKRPNKMAPARKLPTETLDPMLQQISDMKTYPIAYETPTEGKIGEAFEVVLAIDATGDDSAIEGLPGENTIVEGEALLTQSAEATLSGAAFDIKLMNKDRQRLSPYQESTWRWSVTPRQKGQHKLYLEIHAVLGEGEAMLLKSFEDEISVSVGSGGLFLGMSADTLRTYIGIIAGIISGIVGMIALIGFIRRRPGKEKGGDNAGYVDSDKTDGMT